MNSKNYLSVIFFGFNIFCGHVYALDSDSILKHLRAAGPSSAAAAAAPVPGANPQQSQVDRLNEEQTARFEVLSTCEGRFGGLQQTLKKQVSRSETISTVGGLIGVIGAVATCPHCAALAAGLAGLANPLQQTFKDNADTPQDTQDKLNKLSTKINEELDSYSKLPPAIVGDSDFEKNLRGRLDLLFVTTATCQFFNTSLQAVK